MLTAEIVDATARACFETHRTRTRYQPLEAAGPRGAPRRRLSHPGRPAPADERGPGRGDIAG